MSYEIEVDTKLADLHGEHAKLEQKRAGVVRQMLNYAGAEYHYEGRRRVTSMTEDQAITKLIAGDHRKLHYGENAQDVLDKFMDVEAELETSNRAITKQAAKYRGWSRFFLVTSSNGHIHRSMDCSTCRWSTQFGWMPNLSGKSEAEAIKFFGPAAETLCTVCFPDAPSAANRNLTQKEIDALQKGETPATKPAKNYCPGSGNRAIEPTRTGYCSGNWGTCGHCHGRIALSSAYNLKLRKHEIKSN